MIGDNVEFGVGSSVIGGIQIANNVKIGAGAVVTKDILEEGVTVIGVAFFAQWSILSNITAGIIVFFSSPFRIGDTIKILDKDYPIEAKIIDIKSFYTLLKTTEGEQISLPNNLLLQKGIVIVSEKKYAVKIKP